MNNIFSKTSNLSQKSLSTDEANDSIVESMLIFSLQARVKGMSLYVRKRAEGKKVPSADGSLTVEAAIILPIFTCFIIAILFFFRVVECQLALEKSMDYAARQAASVMNGGSLSSGGQALAFSTAYSRAGEQKKKSDYPLWPNMNILAYTSGDDLIVDAVYSLTLPMPLIGTKTLAVKQEVKSREWVGYTGGGGGPSEAQETLVYVVADPDVYHLLRSCTYLDPEVNAVAASKLDAARSSGGSRYTPCLYCKPSLGSGTYYISPHGTKYHSSPSCSRLKRTVYTKYLSEVEGVLPPCSKCGGGG